MDQLYILDDEIEYLNLLAQCASGEGWCVSTESDPVRFLEQGVPKDGLLVLDLVMPDRDGIEIIQHLVTHQSKVSLILISGFDRRILESAQLLAQAKRITVHACLEKPFDLALFRAALAKARQISS